MSKAISASVLALSFLASCSTIPSAKDRCVVVPQAKLKSDNNRLADVAVKLEKLPVSVDLKSDFSAVVKAEFSTITDDNAALLLFSRAIVCYQQSTKASSDTAKDMFQLLRDWWNVRRRIQGTGGTIWSPEERQHINTSAEHATEIFEITKRFGVN